MDGDAPGSMEVEGPGVDQGPIGEAEVLHRPGDGSQVLGVARAEEHQPDLRQQPKPGVLLLNWEGSEGTTNTSSEDPVGHPRAGVYLPLRRSSLPGGRWELPIARVRLPARREGYPDKENPLPRVREGLPPRRSRHPPAREKLPSSRELAPMIWERVPCRRGVLRPSGSGSRSCGSASRSPGKTSR